MRTKLTEISVKNLKPGPSTYLVWDTLQANFAVAVAPTGNKAFKVIYKFGGRRRDYHLGAVAAIGLSNARTMARRIMYQVAEGTDPQAVKRAARTAGTFGELVDLYAAYKKKQTEKNKAWQQSDRLVRKHLLPKWSKLSAAAISRSDVKATVGNITAPIVANQTLAAASAIFTWAIREEVGGVSVNPCVGVERNATTSRERVLSETEVAQFWRAFGEHGVRGAALRTILLLGQRPGETSAMRSEHLVDGFWHLPGERLPDLKWPGTKNSRSHRVWVSAPAKVIIAAMDVDGFVFAGRRGAAVFDLDAAMREVCEQLGVPRATPHDLRRTNGTLITSLGFGRDAMNRIQNHADGGIADVYDRHQYAEENKRILETVAARIMALVEGKADGNVVALNVQR